MCMKACFLLFLLTSYSACHVSWTGLYANDPIDGYEAWPFDQYSGKMYELTASGELYVAEGSAVLLLCQDGRSSTQICVANKFTLVWKETACTSPIVSSLATADNSRRCFADEQYTSVYIDVQGYKTDLYELCFNAITMSTREVKYVVRAGATAVFYNLLRPYDRWDAKQYKQFPVAKAYTRKQQLLNIATSFEGGLKYWTQHYLQRGHLCTFAAFPFFFERNATCEYANNSPQWESVNLGNVAKVEAVFAQVAAQNGHLEVVHIHYKQLKLKDDFGMEHKIALLPRANLVEVPQYILKYARDPVVNIRFVFVVLNNPFLKSIPQAPCTPQTNSVFWRPEYFRTNTDKDIIDGYTWLCLASDMYYSPIDTISLEDN